MMRATLRNLWPVERLARLEQFRRDCRKAPLFCIIVRERGTKAGGINFYDMDAAENWLAGLARRAA